MKNNKTHTQGAFWRVDEDINSCFSIESRDAVMKWCSFKRAEEEAQYLERDVYLVIKHCREDAIILASDMRCIEGVFCSVESKTVHESHRIKLIPKVQQQSSMQLVNYWSTGNTYGVLCNSSMYLDILARVNSITDRSL